VHVEPGKAIGGKFQDSVRMQTAAKPAEQEKHIQVRSKESKNNRHKQDTLLHLNFLKQSFTHFIGFNPEPFNLEYVRS
jgi:hypothetical protein